MTALATAQRSKREADEKLFESYVDQARALRMSRKSGQRFESLERLRLATDLARALHLPDEKFHGLRDSVIATLALPDMRMAGPWNPWPSDASHFDFDEAYATYARVDRKGNCSVRRVADDVEVHYLPWPGGALSPRVVHRVHLSRDGQFVAVHTVRFRAAKINRGTSVALEWRDAATPAHRGASPTVLIFVAMVDRSCWHIAMVRLDCSSCPAAGSSAAWRPIRITRDTAIALHPTEPLVAVSSYFGNHVVQLRDLRTGEVVASLPQSDGVTAAVWNRDGQYLAVGLDHAKPIRLYDLATLQLVRTFQAQETGKLPRL